MDFVAQLIYMGLQETKGHTNLRNQKIIYSKIDSIYKNQIIESHNEFSHTGVYICNHMCESEIKTKEPHLQ